MPKVSVILPNYNHAKFLDERLISILQQSFQDFELIILDDSSTDNSLEVLNNYFFDTRIRFYPNDKNSGNTFMQWSKGIALAKGEYIWIAESDDVAHKDFLAKTVEVLDKSPNTVLVFTRSELIDENGNGLGIFKHSQKELNKLCQEGFYLDGTQAIRAYFLRSNIIPNASSVLLRKSALPQLGKELFSFKLAGDWFFYTQLAVKGEIGFLSDRLNFFRVHSATVRNSTQKTSLGILEHIKIIRFARGQIKLSCSDIFGAFSALFSRFGFVSHRLSLLDNAQVFAAIFKLNPAISIISSVYFLKGFVAYYKTEQEKN